MSFQILFFYLFSFLLVASSLVVVTSRNMVYSVMFLILSFLNASALFLLVGAEFFAMLLIIVYVGAVAVLFLFVVMMLNVDRVEIKSQINRGLPLLILVSLVIFTEIFLMIKFSSIKLYDTAIAFPTPSDVSNVKAIGNVLYTDFILPFQLAGGVLFVAMIGAIALTLKEEVRFIKKQNISNQVSRTKSNSLEIVKVKSGEGIDL